MHASGMTKVASPSWHRFSLAPDRFRHRFGNTHNPHIFHWFLKLPGTCDQSGVKSLRAHLAEKLQKSIAFNDVSSNLRGPLEAWGWEDKKNGQPKWTPKSAQGICEKHLFFRLILLFLLFGIHLVAAPGAPFTCEIVKKALVLQCFGRLAWTQRMARKGTSQIIRNGFRISRGTKS